jgi:hypothetical protein
MVGEVQLEEVNVVYLKLGYCITLSLLVKITWTQSVYPIVPEEIRSEYFEEYYCWFERMHLEYPQNVSGVNILVLPVKWMYSVITPTNAHI